MSNRRPTGRLVCGSRRLVQFGRHNGLRSAAACSTAGGRGTVVCDGGLRGTAELNQLEIVGAWRASPEADADTNGALQFPMTGEIPT